MSDDETYEIPLQDQRVFGAGIKRKRVRFVPSSSSSTAPAPGPRPAKSVSDLYLSLVLPGEPSSPNNGIQMSAASSPHSAAPPNAPAASTPESRPSQVCEICNLLVSPTDSPPVIISESLLPELRDGPAQRLPPSYRPHEASIAHQVCLTHSYPPSHLDRKRKGLAYLSAYGWDPDARQGLGAEGQGIQFPIKTKLKDDKLGIGVQLPREGQIKKREKVEKLDAGKVRKLQEKDRRKGQKLREMFYRSEDVERYLGRG